MSLRFFHLVFITISTLLCLGIAGWEYQNFRASGASAHLVGVGVTTICAIALMSYGVWFFRKSKRLIL